MNENHQEIILYPPTRIEPNVCFMQAALPFAEDVFIDASELVVQKEVFIPYADCDIWIGSCEIAILHAHTRYGHWFRAYRILRLSDLSAETVVKESYDTSYIPKLHIDGILSVEDMEGIHLYIIDRWYDSEAEKQADGEDYRRLPDLLAMIHMMTRPLLRDQQSRGSAWEDDSEPF